MTLRQMTIGCLAAGMALCLPAVVDAGEEGLVSSAEAVSPVLVGTAVPDGALTTADGRDTTLGALLDGKPGVLVFYRGHW